MSTCATCRWMTKHPTLGARCQRYPTPTSTSLGYLCGEYDQGTTTAATPPVEAPSKATATNGQGTATSRNKTSRKPAAKAKSGTAVSKD